MKTGWKTLVREERITDIRDWVKETAQNELEVHVGTDSLQTGKYTQFVTVVVIHRPGKGGRVAYTREVVPRIKQLRERLLKETYKSTELALEILDSCPADLTIHIDANTDEKHLSSKYYKELVGLVMGQGFKAVVKPEAWAATTAADHLVRHHGKLPYKEMTA